jgi:recombinational DNA repair ATPase RecF
MSSPLPGSSPPLLVGRERELAFLRQHLTTSLQGSGSIVLIGGEAGAGKTSLAEAQEFCGEAVSACSEKPEELIDELRV